MNTTAIKSKVTERCVYTDITGHILETGDVCLLLRKDKKMLTKQCQIGIYYKDNSRPLSKFILNITKNNNIHVKSIFDRDYKKYSNNFTKNIQLDCIVADFSRMNKEFIEYSNYTNAIKAFEFLQANLVKKC